MYIVVVPICTRMAYWYRTSIETCRVYSKEPKNPMYSIDKVKKDLENHNIPDDEIRKKMDELNEKAKSDFK